MNNEIVGFDAKLSEFYIPYLDYGHHVSYAKMVALLGMNNLNLLHSIIVLGNYDKADKLFLRLQKEQELLEEKQKDYSKLYQQIALCLEILGNFLSNTITRLDVIKRYERPITYESIFGGKIW
jgi:hypothetical protein